MITEANKTEHVAARSEAMKGLSVGKYPARAFVGIQPLLRDAYCSHNDGFAGQFKPGFTGSFSDCTSACHIGACTTDPLDGCKAYCAAAGDGFKCSGHHDASGKFARRKLSDKDMKMVQTSAIAAAKKVGIKF